LILGVRIDKINVRNLGPIERFSMQPADMNVIYGRNEQGKTYLVEFLIHSLFKNVRSWKLRDLRGSGKILVSGLKNGSVEFSPSSRAKMEDFWEKKTEGLPPDFSKLLVVKGAEVELTNNYGGADKAILKHFLTGQELLDSIDEKIPKTIQKADVQNTRVMGNKQGDIKFREELEESLDRVQQLFVQVDRGYSGGRRKNLSGEKKKLEAEFENLEKARRHLAYRLDQEIGRLEDEKGHISEEKLQEARESLRYYRQRIEEYKQKKKQQTEAEDRSRDHEWLTSACDVYQNVLSQKVGRPHPVYLIASGVLVVAAGILAFFRIPVGTVASLAGAILLIWQYFRKLDLLAKKASENEELYRLEMEFQNRFKKTLTGLPLLQELLSKSAEDYSKAKILKDQLFGDLRTIESLKLKLSDQIADLTGSRQEAESWERALTELGKKYRILVDRIQEKKIRLAELGVDSSDYEDSPPDVAYSLENYKRVQEELDAIHLEIEEENQKLATLKQLICQQTGDDIATAWEDLIQHLREKRAVLMSDYQQKTAEIVGKIVVHRVLDDLRKDEDSKIEEGLQSKAILEPLHRITRRYKGLKLDGDRLVVADPYRDYPLSDLSTGAQEQILLALRIGFSTRLLKQENLFLILDDAFQYSDWERRDWLLDMMVDLASGGWQIIYFTMDNHIRDLFEKKGKALGKGFHSAVLNENRE